MRHQFRWFWVLPLLLAFAAPAWSDGVDAQFRQAIRQKFGNRLPYYTIVPYKDKYFGSCCNESGHQRGATPGKPHWAIWEYVHGHWSYIFEFDSEVDADEGVEANNKTFARYQFSPSMRTKLMYGNEKHL
jgi:hypothetical protein